VKVYGKLHRKQAALIWGQNFDTAEAVLQVAVWCTHFLSMLQVLKYLHEVICYPDVCIAVLRGTSLCHLAAYIRLCHHVLRCISFVPLGNTCSVALCRCHIKQHTERRSPTVLAMATARTKSTRLPQRTHVTESTN
jgi:hypothetical protein